MFTAAGLRNASTPSADPETPGREQAQGVSAEN